MNATIQSIILLACAAVCSSSGPIYCRCISTIKSVNPSLIAKVKDYDPRPYCRKVEVIVTLKDGRSLCLDPNEDFTKKLVQIVRTHRMTHSEKVNITSPKTTSGSATMSVTASTTASLTASLRESTTASSTESSTVLPTSS